MAKNIVALVGSIGSGTTSASELLKEHEYARYSYGAEVAEYIRADSARGGIDRANLQLWGHQALRCEHDTHYWDKKYWRRLSAIGSCEIAVEELSLIL